MPQLEEVEWGSLLRVDERKRNKVSQIEWQRSKAPLRKVLLRVKPAAG